MKMVHSMTNKPIKPEEASQDDEVETKVRDDLELLRDESIDDGQIYAGDGVYL